MKNLMDFCIGTPVFWLVGFGIMFGAGNGFFGKIGGIASEANYGNAMLPDGVPFWAFLIFQTVHTEPHSPLSYLWRYTSGSEKDLSFLLRKGAPVL